MQEINIKVTSENKYEFEIESHVHVQMNRNELSQCFYEILKELQRLDELAYISASLKLAGDKKH
jgi:hypothetical protein